MAAAPPRATGHMFRPRSAIAAAICWGLITLAWAWFAVHDGGLIALARQAPGMLLAATLVYAVLVRPSVEVSGAGVALRNVVRDVEVPWAALAEVRTRYALTLVATDGRRFTAWAAPASGRHTDTRLTLGEVRSLGWPAGAELPPSSASLASSSGAVAVWVRREWQRAVEDERAGVDLADGGTARGDTVRDDAVRDDAVRTHLARGVLAAGAVAAALCAVAAIG
ncbi:PH domain-containing protein [Pengzhenrongella phosphoraccumulans]|uniref:PH domain-containing protein n=1 Tax=Pengzhenrongella phosphoraccumulans TaxID=3114394 RepID=UPI00388DEA84